MIKFKVLTCLAAILAYSAPTSAQTGNTRLVQQGVTAGLRNCIPQLNRLVRFVHEDDTEYAMHGIWLGKDPNAATFTSTSVYKAGNEVIISNFSASVNPAGGCDVVVTQSGTTESTCAVLRETTLKDWKYKGELLGQPIYSDPTIDGPGSNVYLSPLPNQGCLLYKRIVAFGVKP